MRQSEDLPLDPDVLAELEAIDATLAGGPVDPIHAELAELALLLAADRPALSATRARTIDDRVLRRSAPAGAAERKRRWRLRPEWALGLTGAVAAGIVAAVVLVPGGSSPLTGGASSTGSGGSSSGAATSAGSQGLAAPSAPAPGLDQLFRSSSKSAASSSAATTAPYSSASNGAAAIGGPVPSARKTIQSAQLQLAARARWISVVAQEVYNVVGQEKGIVRNSQVTSSAGNSGYANFQLSIPSANLSATVNRLSVLQHARVTSRTDGTEDVNGQYLSDRRRLADARALRTSLLKQLAKATTQAQINSLTARIHDAEASIASNESTLRRLQNQIDFSQLQVSINGGPVPLPLGETSSGSSSHGFTLGRAAHDALHVLTVAAGVALITLAALVPVALLVALGLWIAFRVRHRRREHALDTA